MHVHNIILCIYIYNNIVHNYLHEIQYMYMTTPAKVFN